MSPRVADASVRTALIEAAAALIASEGTGALTLRRLADEVGTSTMAIYTHFGSMDELRRELRREGFARLSDHLSLVEESNDPVADLVLLGWEYYLNATANPHLYRVMFMERPVDEEDAVEGLGTFEQLVRGVRRCIDAKRFDEAEPTELATPLWAVNHGIVTLELAQMLTSDQAIDCLAVAGTNLFKAYGDDPRATGRSLAQARRRAGLDGG